MRACGLAEKVYARPVVFFPFMRAADLDDARSGICGRNNRFGHLQANPCQILEFFTFTSKTLS